MNLSATVLLFAVLTLGLTTQSVEGACEGVSDEASLQAQFSTLVAGSVITVCSNINITVTVTVKAPVTLQGNCSSPGCKITAALPRRVNQLFSVAPGVGPVFFRNLQLDGGAAPSSDKGTLLTGGGVLLSPSSATTFTNVLFTNNAADEGGAVFSNSANATFIGCTFIGNTATASGGAFQANGGSAVVLSSNFQQNSAPLGGAVYLQQTAAPAIVRGSLFVRNQATAQQGGAIFVGVRAINASIGGNTFAGNTAIVSGGALHDDGASQGGAVVSTAFTVLSGNSFSQNTAPRGAAVSSSNAQTSFCSPQQFSNNVATTAGNSLFAAGSQNSQGTRFCPTAPSDPAFVSDVSGVFASDCTYCNCGPNNPCDANAICTPPSRTANLTCACRSGFSGNGYVCLTATNSSLLVGNAGSSTNLASLASLTTSNDSNALVPNPVAAPFAAPAITSPVPAFLAAPAPAPALTNSSLVAPSPSSRNGTLTNSTSGNATAPSTIQSPTAALLAAPAPAPALSNSSLIVPGRNGTGNATAPSPNPTLLNGSVTNGTGVNGTAVNGTVNNGTVMNGTVVNGTVVNGPVANGPVPLATTQNVFNGTLAPLANATNFTGPAPAPRPGGGLAVNPFLNANLTNATAPAPSPVANRTNVTASGPSGASAPSPLSGNANSNASSLNGTLPFSTNATLNATAPPPPALNPPPPLATNATSSPPPPQRPPPPIATNASFPPPQSPPPPAFPPPTPNATLPLVTNTTAPPPPDVTNLTAPPPPVATNATAPPPPNVTISPPPSFPPPASPPPNPPPASPPPNPPPASPPPSPPPPSPPPPGAPPPPLVFAPVSQPPLVATSPASPPPTNPPPPGLPPPGAPPPPLPTAPVSQPLPAATSPQPAPTAGLLGGAASPPPPVCPCPTGQAPGIGATATACNCNYPLTASYRLADKNLADWTPAFASSFTNSLSNLLGTQPSQILYTNVQQGSILLDTNVVPLAGSTLDNATVTRISGKLQQGQQLDLNTSQFGTVLVTSVGLPAPLTSGTPPSGSGVNIPSPNTAPAATTTSSGGGGTNIGVIIGAVVGGVVALAVILAVIALLVRRRRRKPRLPPPPTLVLAGAPKALDRPMSARERFPGGRESSPLPTPGGEDIADKALFGTFRRFGFTEIQQATADFAPANLLGEGGFGLVYKGTFADGTMLAVKYLKNTQQGQAQSEFLSELGTLGRVRHRNLVALKGFCVSNDDCFLILDFAAGGNLDQALRNPNRPVLTWPQRLNIAVGAARGLSYLHNDCRPTIIHRDIKSANILLDADGEAEVADFGLSKLLDSGQTHQSTRVRGTYGYVAPEYAMYGQVTKKTDVYSFGVVLLELITGLKALDVAQTGERRTLAEWVLKRHQQPLTIMDPRLEGEYFREQAEKFISLAIACINISGDRRPSMLDILRTLETLNPSGSVPASPLGSPERSGEMQDVYPTTSSDWSLGTGSGTRQTPVRPSSGGSGSSPAATNFSWSQANSSTLLHNTTQYDVTGIKVGR